MGIEGWFGLAAVILFLAPTFYGWLTYPERKKEE